MIERAAILARNGRLFVDLPRDRGQASAQQPLHAAPPTIMTETERRARDRSSILAALEAAGGKISGPGGAAEIMGLRPTTLASRIKVLDIRWMPNR